MRAEALAWWWTFASGAVMGAVVTAVACGRLATLGRLWDRILGDRLDRPPARSSSAHHQASCVRLVHDEEVR